MTKLLDLLLARGTDGVCRFALKTGHILSANAGLANLLECAPEERLEGQTVRDRMPPLSGPSLDECFSDRRGLQEFEYRFTTRSGRTCQVRVLGYVAHDRREKKKVAEALFLKSGLSVERVPGEGAPALADLMNATADGMYLCDEDGRLLDVNRRACELLGYAREELLARNIQEVISGFEQKGCAGLLGEAKERTLTRMVYCQRRDGTRFPAAMELNAFASARPRLLGCVVHDLTERFRHEEVVRQLKSDLERCRAARVEEQQNASQELRQELAARQREEDAWREQSGFLGVLLETVPVPIFFKDTAGRYLGCNRAFETFLGLPRDRIIGKTAHELAPSEAAAVFERGDRDLLAGGDAQHYGSSIEGQDGRSREVIFHKAAFRRGDGSTGGLVGVILDVTERQQAEREIRALNASLRERAKELETANRELQTFSYSVSHDLRAPLRAVSGFAEALLEDHGAGLSGEALDYLNRIRAAAKRMDELIDDLLKLARVMRAEMHGESIDLSVLAGLVCEELRRAAPERPVEVRIAPDMGCTGDPRLLRIVLENLLGNAWKFTLHRSPARISVDREEVDGQIAFCVRDNGVGFDMAHVRKLFVPFQRLHTVLEFPGHGIGLATVQRIVARHGGRAWAEGQPGEGARFYFTLGAK